MGFTERHPSVSGISCVFALIVSGRALLVLSAIFCWIPSLPAQLVTSSVVGTVVDNSGAGIPAVNLRLVAEATGAIREATSDELGNFVFSAIPPGSYTLIVEHKGFKRYEKTDLDLPPNERLSVGEIRLELGKVAEQVTVRAEGASIQTASGERSGIISSEQIENLTVINRDFSVLVALQPGVVDNPGAEAQGFSGNATFNVLGGRTGANNITIDGVPSDNSNGVNTNTFISMDSVASVKILVSNFQAEFGRKPGAGIQAVTKSGSRKFHGLLYWYKRHEQFNANNFFNNRLGVPEAPYRYAVAGFNLGGPLYIPGVFNRDRKQLFFFFSSEQLREKRPQDIRQITVPTALERQGDFSQSFDTNGRLITILDPANGRNPFPGNVIPQDRINANMQKYLNLVPVPNVSNTDISGRRYNYQVQESLEIPKHSETLRVDHNLSTNTTIYGRVNYWWENVQGFAVPAGNANWGWLPNNYNDISSTATLSTTHIFSRSMVLEASMGVSHWTEASKPGLNPEFAQRLNRFTSGVNIPQFHPENNPLNLVPQADFGGISQPPSATYAGRFPIQGVETIFTWNAVLTNVRGSRASKAGLFVERWWEDKGPDGNFAGRFNFGRDANNPNDANNPYANALLGNFASYTESTTRPALIGRVTGIEWFAQDNWKVNRKLTLDLGVRFGWSQPFHSNRRDEAGFVPDRFDPTKAVTLIRPALRDGKRVGINPLTGQVLPAATIGAIVPGSGDQFNGIVDARVDRNYPAGLRNTSGIKAAPRFGFAYDPFGKGKTAIRGGIGIFYQIHDRDNFGTGVSSNPPLKLDPTIFFENLDTFTNQVGFNFPTSSTGFNPDRPLQRITNYSIGVQQDIGFGTVVDISYVGALSRHLLQRRNLNAVPFGTNFLPSSFDPTTGRPLSAAFLRPYPGYNDIQYSEYAGNSSYHSLQVTANRRAAKGLDFGIAWTWSKAMDYVDSETGSASNLIDPKVWNYGKAGFDRTHIVKMYWTWNLPRASRVWNTGVVRKLLDDWTLSGINTLMSGAPMGIGLGFTYATDITGSPTDGARVVVVKNPVIPKWQRTFSHYLNTDAFVPPAVGSFGNAPKDVIRGPGINNWDISFFKKIPLPGERLKLQFRGEFYNAFNHTQFKNLDINARFDGQGNQVNPRFGEFTEARPARRVQLALRLNF